MELLWISHVDRKLYLLLEHAPMSSNEEQGFLIAKESNASTVAVSLQHAGA